MASFAVRVPGHLADLQRVCTNQICPYGQLGPEAAQTFQALGLSLGGYAVLQVALTIAAALTYFVVVAVLVWRKADD